MADPNDPDSLPTQQWSSVPDGKAPASPSPLSDSVIGGMLGAKSPATRGGWQPPTPEELQARLPQHQITELLGRGGMGAVYKGWQRSLERFVAIKILPPGLESGEVDFAARFKREARAMAKLKHPGIIPVHDAGETADGLLYFVMDFVEGTDVQKTIATRGKLPPEEALPITAHVLDALAYAHRHGIIHRDIKPANIMVDEEGNVHIADFGLARSTAPDSTMLTMSNMAMGTPDFMAPESHLGMDHVDHRADLYAVGVMLYQMLTGKLPRGRFDPPSRAVPGLDKRLDVIVDRTLQNERDARYSSAIELRAALEPVLTRTMAKRVAAHHGTPSLRKKPRILASIVLGSLAVAGLAAWLLMNEPTEAENREDIGSAISPEPMPLSSPNAQASTATTFPPGQWLKPFPDLSKLPNLAELKDGWATLKSEARYLHVLAPSGSPVAWTDAGIRVRLRGVGPADQFGGQLQIRSTQGTSYGLHYYPRTRKIVIARYREGSGQTTLAFAPAPELPEGVEYVMELTAVGRQLIGRFNGQEVSASVEDAEAQRGGLLGLIGVEKVSFRDVEAINLDGLPEAEARKLIGIEKP